MKRISIATLPVIKEQVLEIRRYRNIAYNQIIMKRYSLIRYKKVDKIK